MQRRQVGFVHLKGGVGATVLTTAYAHHWALHEGPVLIVDTVGLIRDLHASSPSAKEISPNVWLYQGEPGATIYIMYDPQPLLKTIDTICNDHAGVDSGVTAVLIDSDPASWPRNVRLLNCPLPTTTSSVTAQWHEEGLTDLTGNELVIETFARLPSEPGRIRFPISGDWDAALENGMLSPAQLGHSSASSPLVRLHHALKAIDPSGPNTRRRLDMWVSPSSFAALEHITDIDAHTADLLERHGKSPLDLSRERPPNAVRLRRTINHTTHATLTEFAETLDVDVTRALRGLLAAEHDA